ncbi:MULTISPECIES: hypothetical protein [Streptomyces]|uniref:Uncharacterized protein n=1 Tax=Streptomyces odorifer TaxID=53450 RepID=A0A7Y6C6F6_9ACTN|nr:hypothetical protein [Streptomyces odorifer]NUV27262.1 hypothetical protein [Streptomyces odorifer]NUV37975.1 hypothetical protein [Streptomyces sp. KAI-27]NUV50855.1 hypothetical protein [Streptomyces sp. CAI-78]
MVDTDTAPAPAGGITPTAVFALGHLAASLREEGHHADAGLIRRVLADAVEARWA